MFFYGILPWAVLHTLLRYCPRNFARISLVWPHLYSFNWTYTLLTISSMTHGEKHGLTQTMATTNTPALLKTHYRVFHSLTHTDGTFELFVPVCVSLQSNNATRSLLWVSPDDCSQAHPGFSSVLHSETVSYSFFTLCKNTAQKLDVSY